MSGRPASLRIASRSAPPAKIFTVLSPRSVIPGALRCPPLLLNPGRGFRQDCHGDMRADGCRLIVVRFHVYRSHSGGPGGAEPAEAVGAPPAAPARVSHEAPVLLAPSPVDSASTGSRPSGTRPPAAAAG